MAGDTGPTPENTTAPEAGASTENQADSPRSFVDQGLTATADHISSTSQTSRETMKAAENALADVLLRTPGDRFTIDFSPTLKNVIPFTQRMA